MYVNNQDNKCFLYSLAALKSYNRVAEDVREHADVYEDLIKEFVCEE